MTKVVSNAQKSSGANKVVNAVCTDGGKLGWWGWASEVLTTRPCAGAEPQNWKWTQHMWGRSWNQAKMARVPQRKRRAERERGESRLGPDRGAPSGVTGCIVCGAWCKVKNARPLYGKFLRISRWCQQRIRASRVPSAGDYRGYRLMKQAPASRLRWGSWTCGNC